MKIIIDRIESETVVVEITGGTTIDLPRRLFPGATEGDVYTIVKDASGVLTRKKRIAGKMDRLFTE